MDHSHRFAGDVHYEPAMAGYGFVLFPEVVAFLEFRYRLPGYFLFEPAGAYPFFIIPETGRVIYVICYRYSYQPAFFETF